MGSDSSPDGEWLDRSSQYRSNCSTWAVNREGEVILPFQSLLLWNVSFHFSN